MKHELHKFQDKNRSQILLPSEHEYPTYGGIKKKYATKVSIFDLLFTRQLMHVCPVASNQLTMGLMSCLKPMMNSSII